MTTRNVSYETDELAALVIMTVSETQDMLRRQLPLLDAYHRIYGKGGYTKNGGQKWKTDVEVAEHSGMTGIPTGYESIDLTTVGILQSMIFSPGFVTAPFLASVVERAVFNGSAEAKAAIARRAKNVTAAVMRYWHTHSLSGGVAAFSTGLWGTLNGTDYATAGSAGYIEEDAHGSQGNEVGGLSKATYASANGMQNYSYDLGGAVGSNGRLGFITTRNLQRERLIDRSKCVYLASQQGATHFARVMWPYRQYVNDQAADIIGPDFKIDGQDCYPTSDMPTAGTNTTAAPWSVLSLDMGSVYPIFLKNDEIDGMFGVVPMKGNQHSGDRRVDVGYVDCAGQWLVDRFDSTALFYDGESF